jgi:hypothetical protein
MMLTNEYPVPERCLLAQAATYVMCGRFPISDEIYLAVPTADVISADDLIRALRAGVLTAEGELWDGFRQKGDPSESIRDFWDDCPFAPPLRKGVPIKRELWSREQTDLNQSSLVASYFVVKSHYQDEFRNETFLSDERPVNGRFLFAEITIFTSDLFSKFPPKAVPATKSAALAPEKPSPRRAGRPPKYDWDRFFAELIVRADLDGLPATQAELVSQMANWCLENWGEQPADSVLKEKTAAIFNHPRKNMQQKPEIRTSRFPAIPG